MKVVSISAAAARAEFQQLLSNGALTPAGAARLAEEAAQACLASSSELDDAALLLSELAMLGDAELARAGVDGIFRRVIETMADAFDPRLSDLYVQFFAKVLGYCRRLPPAAWLDERLQRFGLEREPHLVHRAVTLRRPRRVAGAVKKVVVLSRVTLGADVAITSVILQKIMRDFPDARLALLASGKAGLLFAGESRVVVRRVEYPRGGGLIERLAAWPAVADQVQVELEGLRPGDYLVVDPDSRLTQLGMLPVVEDESAYHFFESRSFSKPGLDALPDLTAAWLEEVFGPHSEPVRPWVSLPTGAIRFARAVTATASEARWVAVNFGVGENPGKRIEGAFEQRLLSGLLDLGWRIFLDKGEGAEEIARAQRLLAGLREAGWQVSELDEHTGLPAAGARVVAWQGSLAGFGALIGVSELYIGYDSACQHIAAALGVKTIDIFAGFRSPRMVERWRPSGTAPVRMIVVDPGGPPDPEGVLRSVLEAAR